MLRRRPRARRLRSAGARPRRGDRPHLPARPQVRRGARPQGARRERQARHGHHGLLRRRRLPGRRRHRGVQPRRARAWSGRARSRRPTCTSSPPARTPRSSRPPRRWPPSWSPPGSPCSTTTGRRSRPGVKFKDAELLGMPTIVTVGRGLAERDDRAARPGDGEREEVPVAEAAARVLRRRPGLSTGLSATARRRSVGVLQVGGPVVRAAANGWRSANSSRHPCRRPRRPASSSWRSRRERVVRPGAALVPAPTRPETARRRRSTTGRGVPAPRVRAPRWNGSAPSRVRPPQDSWARADRAPQLDVVQRTAPGHSSPP